MWKDLLKILEEIFKSGQKTGPFSKKYLNAWPKRKVFQSQLHLNLNELQCMYTIDCYTTIRMDLTSVFPLTFDSKLFRLLRSHHSNFWKYIRSSSFIWSSIKIQRCPFCTYSTISSFKLSNDRARFLYSNLAHSRPSTSNTIQTVFSNLKDPLSITVSDEMSYFDIMFISSVPSSIQESSPFTHNPRPPANSGIEKLTTFWDTVAVKYVSVW